MAFCLVDDHKRQDEVFALIKTNWNKGPDAIRRMLTEKTVRADDRRALFIGAEAYKAAGGLILRDLFDEDDGGWLQDVPLLETLVSEKLAAEAATIKEEGWGWVEAAVDFPWNHQRAYRPLKPIAPALTDAEEAEFEAVTSEFEELDSTPEDELSAEAKDRLQTVKQLLVHYENKSPLFDEAQKAKAGAFVSLSEDGTLLIERGYLRREDEADEIRERVHFVAVTGDDGGVPQDANFSGTAGGAPVADDEDDGTAALPDRLMIELTAHHSLALREALANDPAIAFLAILHALTLRLFYNYTTNTCLQVEAKDSLTSPFPGLADASSSKAIAARHRNWEEALPERPEDLWDMLTGLDTDNRDALFAHCAGLTINAIYEPHIRISGRKRHADQLATALQLDMTKAGWVTRADNYLNRITKAGIIAAVREAKGDTTADLIIDLKKKEMACEAERLLDGTDWLPGRCARRSPLTKILSLGFRPSSKPPRSKRPGSKPPSEPSIPKPWAARAKSVGCLSCLRGNFAMTVAETAPSAEPPNRIIENLKRAIFDALATAHIADVHVEYDTDGDDGKLEAHPFSCTDENNEAVACPEITIQKPLSFAEKEAPRFHKLGDAIFGLVYLLLDQDPCTWIGEDGSFGTVRFLVPRRAIELTHNRRFARYETSTRLY